jgi:tetratricopeptide (TPR) repeat protein
VRAFACALALCAAAPWPCKAGADRVAPLDLPHGPLPTPEEHAHLAPAERIALASQATRERGQLGAAWLAWAALESAPGAEAGRAAAALAPQDAGVRFEVFLRTGSPGELWCALVAAATELPAQLWLSAIAVGALGIATLGAALGLALIGFGRMLSLHGHALGHLGRAGEPPVWPGALAMLAAVALLPLFGAGPALLLGVLGAAAEMRLAARDARVLAAALALCGLALGPVLDGFARVASAPSADASLIPAWRVDRGAALPGDEATLSASLRASDASLAHLALATAAKRTGRIERARELLSALDETGPLPLRARAENLLGIVELSEGDLRPALASFERARAHEESAPVLYNLAQAHARALELVERETMFEAARALDAELVASYAAQETGNANRYLVEVPLPARLLFERALRESEEASALAAGLRRAALGEGIPELGWLALPALGALGLGLRRRSIVRCTRCLRPVCSRCGGRRTRGVCLRCERLLARDGRVEAPIRKQELERDRRRLAWLHRVEGASALVLPGIGQLFTGRPLAGAALLALVSGGAGALALASAFPAPAELGALGGWLVRILAILALGFAYLAAIAQAARRIRSESPR